VVIRVGQWRVSTVSAMPHLKAAGPSFPDFRILPRFNQSINTFITHHSTEARATMSLSQTENECLKSVLENVDGWSRTAAEWKRVPESWCRDRETTSSNVDVVRGNGKKTLC